MSKYILSPEQNAKISKTIEFYVQEIKKYRKCIRIINESVEKADTDEDDLRSFQRRIALMDEGIRICLERLRNDRETQEYLETKKILEERLAELDD